jgi:hypothetical protein
MFGLFMSIISSIGGAISSSGSAVGGALASGGAALPGINKGLASAMPALESLSNAGKQLSGGKRTEAPVVQTQSFMPEINNLLTSISQQPPQQWSTDKAYSLLQMLRRR